MASTSRVTGYEHLISLKKFDTSVQRMMERVTALVGEARKSLSIPIMIGINVDYQDNHDDLFVLRNFLHRLRRIHQQYFVRFVTDTLWAMESDNGHLFYTHDGAKEERCDIIWHVKVLSDEQVEVWVSKTDNPDRLTLLTETTIKLKRFVSGVGDDASDEQIVHLLHRFYGRMAQLHYVKTMTEDFHVLLIPSFNNKGYYSIPLYGMSYFDAQRKFNYLQGQMEFTRRSYYDTLPTEIDMGDAFYATLTLLQDNGNFGVARKSCHDTYNLAEQLFAIFVGTQQTRQSNHDIVLFYERDHERCIIDSYRSSMVNLDENLNCQP